MCRERETGYGDLRACLGFRASPLLHLCPLLASFRALRAHAASPAPAPGMVLSRSRAPAPSQPVPKLERFREKSPWMVSPPGLPNPERLQGKQSSPCAPRGLLTRIRSSFFPPRGRTKAAGVRRVPLHQNRAWGRGWLLAGKPGLFVANVGQGKGGSSARVPAPLVHRSRIALIQGEAPQQSSARLQNPTSPGSPVKGGFKPKR